MRKINLVTSFILTTPLFVLLGCTSMTDVQGISADKQAYMNKKFAPTTLKANLAERFNSEYKRKSNFKEMVVNFDVNIHSNDGKESIIQQEESIKTTSTTLVQILTENSNNGISYGMYYSLSYLGLVDLRWQKVLFEKKQSDQLYEIKDIDKFDSFPPKPPKSDFFASFTTGIDMQIANYPSFQFKCATGTTQPAQTLNANLAGNAINMNCDHIANNVVKYKINFVWLEDYGIALNLGNTSSSGITKKIIKSITIK